MKEGGGKYVHGTHIIKVKSVAFGCSVSGHIIQNILLSCFDARRRHGNRELAIASSYLLCPIQNIPNTQRFYISVHVLLFLISSLCFLTKLHLVLFFQMKSLRWPITITSFHLFLLWFRKVTNCSFLSTHAILIFYLVLGQLKPLWS